MNRKGFTLIELLIVVVIIGILAAIAIPKFANTKEKAYIAAMKSDLRNLVSAEEAYYADKVEYTDNLEALNFSPSAGVTVRVTLVEGPPAGWSATATHNGTTKQCAIAINTANPFDGRAADGEPVCQ
jgi:prepilin-type N-terminal cleavage/methylation domain-containing protein